MKVVLWQSLVGVVKESEWTTSVEEAATTGQNPTSVLGGEEEDEGERVHSGDASSGEKDRILGF